MTRGLVLGLTPAQVVARARYLGGLSDASVLDSHVTAPALHCPEIFYLLSGHNGGKDPTACDPADRWIKPDEIDAQGNRTVHTFTNRTADCIGGGVWCAGFDRYQPVRFGHIYNGWINTDSMIADAIGPAKCFEVLDKPEPGCFVVAETHAAGFEECGHIGTVYACPPPEHFDRDNPDSWRHVLAVHVADLSPARANQQTTGSMWFAARNPNAGGYRSIFCRSIMAP